MTAVLVFLGAGAGAALRYLTDRVVQRRHCGVFPWGTLAVNVVGSALLGTILGAGHLIPPAVTALAGIGFSGALTTYSTFSYETFRLIEDRAYSLAVRNIFGSVLGTCVAALVAYTATSAVV
ncbi:fluoride efflux transporter CrcB [Allosaccharopolyspora coralli]|uniref:Fluoride-specific ion channel FluC n=1 Tax=Allosaccharopolyspora coralli TaxID=2665642 RepID=A0A5Q3Q4P4_9PSEU|nr:fluoride efflux transporter CrcB [Allosaccharopolyspora coralli]QGK69588.1 fluoride efflux transporter CrcB [Allosaccharopolyspora coralli]